MSEEVRRHTEAPSFWEPFLPLGAIARDGTPYEARFSLPLAGCIDHWRQEYLLAGPVEVAARASRQGERIFVELDVSTDVTLPCARCLAPAHVSVHGTWEGLFASQGTLMEKSAERDSPDGVEELEETEEIIGFDPKSGRIDLAEWIWEALVMALPASALCREDCLGLCLQCGANRNENPCGCAAAPIDPRFEAIGKLLEEDDSKDDSRNED